MNDTPTPRTDAATINDPYLGEIVTAYFAKALERQLAEATREIDILRRYGNKDCTAMADEELASANQQEKPSVLVSGQCAGVLEMYYRQPLPNPPTV